jgi:hypothetical protein
MRAFFFLFVLTASAMAQPADCTVEPPSSALPLSLGIGGMPGVPLGLTGNVYVAVPIVGATSCDEVPAPPRDILHGNPMPPGENVLSGKRGNLLRGPAR